MPLKYTVPAASTENKLDIKACLMFSCDDILCKAETHLSFQHGLTAVEGSGVSNDTRHQHKAHPSHKVKHHL
jgi:hypothetical protein